MDEARSTDEGLFGLEALSAAFWGWVKEVGWRVPYADRAASYTARFRSGQVAAVGTAPESHVRGVYGFVGVAVRGDIVEKVAEERSCWVGLD